MSYLVSVVVPTKNRYCYLKHLIRLVDSFKLSELELVIQDNSDDNEEIVSYLNQVNNINIKYYYNSGKLSMAQNANLAVLNATGEYICLIGDDDGVCRNIMQVVRSLKENDIEAARTDNAYYIWKDKVRVSKWDKPHKWLNSEIEFNRLLKHGLILPDANPPLLYHAIVKKEILMKVHRFGNTVFPGGSPDISVSVCLCFLVNKYISINIPVVINGTSEMTGGGIVKKHGRVIDLKKVNFVDEEVIENWPKKIPPIWCGSYAWPVSGISALNYCGKAEYITKINYNYLLARSFVLHHNNRSIRFFVMNYSNNFAKIIYFVVKIYTKKVLAFIHKRVFANKYYLSGKCKNIIEAEEYIYNNILKSDGRNLNI